MRMEQFNGKNYQTIQTENSKPNTHLNSFSLGALLREKLLILENSLLMLQDFLVFVLIYLFSD